MRSILSKLLLAITLASFTATSANAMFLQPDWWEVTEPGVGTNRYAYSMGDPVIKSDPSGHSVENPNVADRFMSAIAQSINQLFKQEFPDHDWDNRNAVTSIPGVEFVPGITPLLAFDSGESNGRILSEIGLEFGGAAIDATRLLKRLGGLNHTKSIKLNSQFAPNRLDKHFQDHGMDFGATSREANQDMASNFLSGPRGSNVLERTRSNGDILRFDTQTQAFGVVTNGGTIRTYYVPAVRSATNPRGFDPKYSSALDYFYDQ